MSAIWYWVHYQIRLTDQPVPVDRPPNGMPVAVDHPIYEPGDVIQLAGPLVAAAVKEYGVKQDQVGVRILGFHRFEERLVLPLGSRWQ